MWAILGVYRRWNQEKLNAVGGSFISPVSRSADLLKKCLGI